MTCHRPPQRDEQLDALFAGPLIHDLAADIDPIGGRARRHPTALYLAFGAMSRLYGSGNRFARHPISCSSSAIFTSAVYHTRHRTIAGSPLGKESKRFACEI